MIKPARIMIGFVIGILLVVAGWSAFWRWTFKLQFPPLAGRGACAPNIDRTSLGRRELEGEMSYVAAMSELYSNQFGKAPGSLHDLEKIPEFASANSLNGRAFERECSLYASPTNSFIVSCGSAQLSGTEAEGFMEHATPTQKFYLLGKSEILYVPAPSC
jgi:hypothetical protein